jgi:zinc transport system permease protein
MTFLTDAISRLTSSLAGLFGTDDFIVTGTIAIVLVSLTCGTVGSLVISNRMAFFSDALAHCAIAGITMGLIIELKAGLGSADRTVGGFALLVTVAFGALVGIGIAYVREKTALGSDTVIGVFFAGALGLGAVLFGLLKQMTNKDPDAFLFGSPNFLSEIDLVRLAGVAILTALLVGARYNQLVFASFNPSLARSRRIPMRAYNYLFIILLALIVNVCLLTVGALLINAMLIVPAATANNVSRNMRQMFWWSIGLSLFSGLAGQWTSLWIPSLIGTKRFAVGTAGCVIIISVLCFAVSMMASRWMKGRQSR